MRREGIAFRIKFVELLLDQRLNLAGFGMAAGLAMNGKVPYVNTIATFLTRRCYDQLAVDVCLGNYDVRLYANGGGFVYAPLGPTHQAIEDIAILRALPNMTVIAPCDADEMERAVMASYAHRGPIYFRVARGGDPIVSKAEHGFAIGRAVPHRRGDDLLMITTGVTLQVALGVAEDLAGHGISVGIIHVHTVKPLDREILEPELRRVPHVVSLEEHTILGGLGSAVAELMAEGARHDRGRLLRLGVPDRFADDCYGRQENLFARFGLDRDSVAARIRGWLVGAS